MDHVGCQLDGYCIARGRNVSEYELDTMIEIMDGYIIPSLKEIGVNQSLRERKSHSILLMDTPYRYLAQRVFSKAKKKGHCKTIDRKEMQDIFAKELGEDVKIIELEPKSDSYETVSVEVMRSIIDIAHTMISEKMGEKTKAFWANKSDQKKNNIE